VVPVGIIRIAASDPRTHPTRDSIEQIVALSPESVKLTLKGHRNGVELKWIDLISGDAALATALQASLGKFTEDKQRSPTNMKPRRKARR
jgi:hypothetical protein